MSTSSVPRTLEEYAAASERLSGAALRLFVSIAELWRLNVADQRTLLGGIAESTFFKYVKNPDAARLSRDTLDRISHVMGVFKAINILLPRHESADAWVRRPNDAAFFKGRSALDYMVKGGGLEHIVDVRRYLDGERSW